MKTSKNVLKAMVLIGIIAIFFINVSIAQTTPTILIDGTSTMSSNISSAPYWLKAGQTLAIGNLVKFISVLQYNIAPAVAGGNNLQFESVLSVTTLQTVPVDKAWKIESVALDPAATIFGGDNLGNHQATIDLNMSSKKISNLANPVSSNDAVNAATLQNGNLVYAAAGGTANAITVTLTPPPTTYSTGMLLSFKAGGADNTGAVTIDVNGLGAKAIKKGGTSALVSGDIKAGQIESVIYDGTNFQMISPPGSSAAAPARFFVGDYYGGGIILLLDSTTQHGIIAAKSIQSSGINWSNVQNTAVGSGAQSFSNGVANTAAIIAQSGHSNSAAKICDDYTNEGFSDWYLPSANELRSLCGFKGYLYNLTFFTTSANSPYWSSTELSSDPATRAVGVSFIDCVQHLNDNAFGMQKSQTYKVWCVRGF